MRYPILRVVEDDHVDRLQVEGPKWPSRGVLMTRTLLSTVLECRFLLTRFYYVNVFDSYYSNVILTPVMVALARVFTSSHSEQSS